MAPLFMVFGLSAFGMNSNWGVLANLVLLFYPFCSKDSGLGAPKC